MRDDDATVSWKERTVAEQRPRVHLCDCVVVVVVVVALGGSKRWSYCGCKLLELC